MRGHPTLCILLILVCCSRGFSQSVPTTQFWWDATYYRPFQINFRNILTVGTRHLLSGGDPWTKMVIKPSVEWYPIPFLDVMTALSYVDTKQMAGLNTVEWRPDIGFRMNFLQQRTTFRTNTRLEYRHIRYQETGTNLNALRFRTRVELIVPVNNSSHRDPKTLYALTDFEIFSDLGGDEVSERFANTSRFRLGVGWRFDLQWRAELLYTQKNPGTHYSRILKRPIAFIESGSNFNL